VSVLEHSQEFRENDNSLSIADFIVALTVIAPTVIDWIIRSGKKLFGRKKYTITV
jgi:hypothetical protein